MWTPQRNMMWPGQQHQDHHHHHHPQPPRVPPPYLNYVQHQPPLLPDPTNWAPNEFMLEQQFGQMSFRQPPPQRMFQPRPSRPSNQVIRPSNSTGIPSLLDIRVPRPSHLNNGFPRGPPRAVYQQQQQQQQQPPIRNNLPTIPIDTSVPPPRITLLQKPKQPAKPVVQQQRPQVEVIPTAQEEVKDEEEVVVQEEEVIKKEPEIKVTTILKRPASTPSNLVALSASNNENESSDPVENLKKREEEYAKVRLRILGSTGTEDS